LLADTSIHLDKSILEPNIMSIDIKFEGTVFKCQKDDIAELEHRHYTLVTS